jgi:hypothetical protein
MNECIACGESPAPYLDFCRDCADLATSDVEGASYVRGMIMARQDPVPMSDPWDKVEA